MITSVFISTFKKLNLNNLWAYYDAHTNQWFGKTKAEMFDFFASTDILLNISGVNPLRDWLLPIPKRVFVDTDPAFTQTRHLTDKNAREFAAKHNYFFTFGEKFGADDCLIPKDGFEWKATRQPVVLNAWKVTKGNKNNDWTTVMQWDSYKTVEYGGQIFGMKSASFSEYLDLPNETGERFKLALGSASAPHDWLENNGWKTINPLIPTRTPWTYQRFIQNSKAEWSVAKQGYVASKSGWFSERSTAYLASGRPILTQETGFSKFIEVGVGLLSFSTKGEAIAGIEKINSDYDSHCIAAREVAQNYFSYKIVLSRLIDKLFAQA